jgi:superfamily II DNA or RNA helicase
LSRVGADLVRPQGTPELDGAIVDVLALLFDPVPRSTLAKAISSAGLYRSLKLPDLYARLQALTEAGVLVAAGESWAVAPAERHRATLEIARRGALDRLAEAVRSARPAKISYHTPNGTWWDILRELHFALYGGRWDEVREGLCKAADPWPALAEGIDPAWFDGIPADLAADAAVKIVHDATVRLRPCPAWRARLEAIPPTTLDDNQHHFLVGRLILEGRLDDARRLATARKSVQSAADLAWLRLLGGDAAGAVDAWEAALTAYLKEFGRRARYFPDRAGLFFVVALLATGGLDRARVLAEAGGAKGVSGVPHGHAVLSWLARSIHAPDVDRLGCPSPERGWDPVEVLLHALARRWTGLPVPDLTRSIADAEAAGLGWLSAQLGRCAGVGANPVGIDLSTLLRRPDRASHALAALEALVAGGRTSVPAIEVPPERDVRLVWVITHTDYWTMLEPREQVRAKGKWSKGRPVALKRLRDEASTMAHLTAADRAASAMIREEVSSGRYRDVSYHLDGVRALRAVAGESNLFVESGGELVPAEVRPGKPRLTAIRKEGEVELALAPCPEAGEAARVMRAGPAAFELVTFEPVHHDIAKILGKKPLLVPLADERRVTALLTALGGRLHVEADLGAGPQPVTSDALPTFELRRRGEGLAIDAVVLALGAGGPRVRAGHGAREVYAEIDGRRARGVRDLTREVEALRAVLEACPSLVGDGALILPEREAALTALSELTAAGASLAWPAGDPIRLVELGPAELELTLVSQEEGFAVEGRLGGTDLGTLLGYLAASPGRFLGPSDRLIALTAELRRRLDELRALSEPGPRLRFHRLRLPLVDELANGAQVRADEGWRAAVSRLTALGEDPPVPSTLRAALRPYQADGFRWLCRLARWGVGGCLADDMGLGKTLQVSALLLHRAPEGPSLVVAPTSVLSVWADEIARWAPTLRVRAFSGPRRAGAIEGLAAYDVVLTSYAILPIDADALAAVRFVVAVLDEAQAIKNPDTARARAASALQADQRVVTTGTPIENRLADLWSLFRFLNPGLLGSATAFEEQLARPIERERSRLARDRLRRLVAPFLLRRTKSEVLTELPPRTETALSIELDAREVATYEAVRAEILERLEAEATGPGRRFALLAGITRLRRAASHPRMVLDDADPSSSKLQALAEILDDVVPSGHKALVFSQFVDHLQLAREALIAAGYRCRYLDGSTPAAARKREIDAFQAGDADVFLISLKAGGVGLNLTAADYVIHLDPWWNPAAEDQASDRSHRLGQTRPVTVYRLVARDTVEDRIVALHHRKRELALGILEGADASGALSEQELLDLVFEKAGSEGKEVWRE